MVVFTLLFVLFVYFDLSFSYNFNISTRRDYGNGYTSPYYLPQASASSGHGWSSHGGGHGASHGGGGGFQSFFDIALTGLAFLSFGIFLLNLLLNALLGSGVITGTVTPTGTVTGTGIITDTGTVSARAEGSGPGRHKRSVATFELDRISSAEAMASIILESIDAMVNEHECVQKVFCDGNKESQSLGHGFQYLFPAYSFGASYIAQKVGLHRRLPDHVKAIFHGIENSNCQQHFPQC